MTNAYHLVARVNPTLFPLKTRNSCVDLWRRLRGKFPCVAACVLMPNHLHLLIFSSHPETLQWDLGVELRAWTRAFYPGSQIWAPIPKPRLIPDLLQLKRQLRYVHLNPCRAQLAKDPLQWEWSTHRDVTGCVVDPWPDLQKLARLFEVPQSKLGDAIHRYVSGDPSVAVTGTPMIRSPRLGEPLSSDLSFILWASAVARREEVVNHRGKLRNLAIQTSHYLRMIPEPAKLKLTQQSWQRLATAKVQPKTMDTVLKILADRRCHMNASDRISLL